MKTTDAESVADELVKMFACVRIPTPGDPNGPGDQLYVPIIGQDLLTPPCRCSVNKYLPSTDGQPRGKVQWHPEGDAEEDSFCRWQGLGQAPPKCILRIS